MKLEIKSRFDARVLFSHEAENNTMRITVEAAVSAGANLAGANLAGANLAGANLAGAYLARANLARANLDGANLARANLDGANLARAYLDGANLDGAYLDGKEKLVGDRPILQIGPIGSRGTYLVIYLTDGGIRVRAGCFFGSLNDFTAKVIKTHGENEHAKEYAAALPLIAAHAEIWSPKVEAVAVEEVAP